MATYLTAAVAGPPGVIAAGTYLNAPKQVELVPIEGDGTPDWTYTGTEFYTASSRDGSVIAAVDAESDSLWVTVHRWIPASPVPLWSYQIKQATRGSYRTIAVSADGSTIAVLVSMQLGSPEARLYLFDPDSPTPIGIYDGAGFARNLSIGEDGSFTAFIGLSTTFVVDRDADLIRWSGNMGATNDPIAISTDGSYLAFGWSTMQVRQWNGSIYESLWKAHPRKRERPRGRPIRDPLQLPGGSGRGDDDVTRGLDPIAVQSVPNIQSDSHCPSGSVPS